MDFDLYIPVDDDHDDDKPFASAEKEDEEDQDSPEGDFEDVENPSGDSSHEVASSGSSSCPSSPAPSIGSEKVDNRKALPIQPLNDRGVLPEYKRLSRLGVLCWFVRRNFLNLFTRLLVLFIFLWLFFFGGFVWCLAKFTSGIGHLSNSGSSSAVSEVHSSGSSDSEEPSATSADSVPPSVPSPSDSPEVEQDKKRSTVYLTLFALDRVYTNNGDILKVGDIINEKSQILEGCDTGDPVYVVSLNFRECCCLLSNGLVLRMRQP